MSKKSIRLIESDLHRIVKESVKRVLREMDGDETGGQVQEPIYKAGDVVYWMYNYSSSFPKFYKVIKVGPKSIWISGMGSKRSNATMGWGSWNAVPDENSISDRVRRISLRPNGRAYVTYCGYREELYVWDGNPISCMSD